MCGVAGWLIHSTCDTLFTAENNNNQQKIYLKINLQDFLALSSERDEFREILLVVVLEGAHIFAANRQMRKDDLRAKYGLNEIDR